MIAAAAAVLAALSAIGFPVTTSDPEAQALIDRGLFFYYAYDGGDAAGAFAAAGRRDPRLAMAPWGEALADGPDLNTPMTAERFARAQRAAQAAVALEAGASPSERAYLDATALRYKGTWDDWPSDDAAYRTAMTAIAQRSSGPGGNDAKVLAAEALLEHGGLAWDAAQPAAGDSRRALELVDDVLASDPNNVMANHLCIHLYDDAADRTPALPCARRLDAAAFPPQAEHLAHMPAHYWIETGNYAAALASSERAYRLFTELQRVPDRNPEHDRYLQHDVYVGYSAALMLGNYATAQEWSARASQVFATPYDSLTALRFGRFDEAYRLAADASPAGLAVRGYAALQLGRLSEARALGDRLRKITTAGYLAQLFFARLAETDGRDDDAAAWIDRAAEQQSATLSAELIPLLPALEARAGLALRQRRYDAAVAAYTQALDAFPNDPRASFGLAQALQAAGRDAEAASARARFDAAWGNGPPPFLL